MARRHREKYRPTQKLSLELGGLGESFLFSRMGVHIMSKKNKRRAVAKIRNQISGFNRHHLNFQGRHWNKGCAKQLRDSFIFVIPIYLHNELHNEVLHDVPVPCDAPDIWHALNSEQPVFANVIDACDWLICHSRDEAYVACIKRQREFFAKSLH